MSQPNLPNLVIIGAMKSATTSLNHYLAAHPEIHMAGVKELDFFVKEQNWGKGLDWYRSWFRTDRKIIGEASPNYTIFPFRRGVPERMHSVIPEAKLIYLVRDPIQRMISHYLHSLFMRRERRPIDEALTDTGSWYFHRSLYHAQLEQYAPYYDSSRILVLSSEDLLADRAGTLKRVFRFVGADENVECEAFEEERHVASGKRQLTRVGAVLEKTLQFSRPMLPARVRHGMGAIKRNLLSRGIERPVLSQAARDRIAAELADDISRLRAYTGREFREWSV
jgi:hypothetical protein